MNPSQESNTALKINKIFLGIFLLFVIVGAGVYSSIKFREVYAILVSPRDVAPIATKVNGEEKETLLASVSPRGIDIEEGEKLDMLRKLILNQNIDVKSRENTLDSLK